MPWSTPTLRNVREMVRGEITAKVAGASFVGNSVLRVLADAQAALAHLVLRYLDWLARQLLPDTAEAEWLDRHGDIWLVNSDSSTGRKAATLATGTVNLTGTAGITVPLGSQLERDVAYETTEAVIIGAGPTPVDIRALDPGAAGNLVSGDTMSFTAAIAGVDGIATVISLTGGTDPETDEQLRARILQRIQNPAMGGAQADYVTWALAVPGVTRAWAAPEQGTGTITVRFLMDDLRAEDDGWPLPADIIAVKDYIDLMRPVTVKDSYVMAPIKQFIDMTILDLDRDDAATRAAIEQSIRDMLFAKAAPGQTIYRSWIAQAISNATGEDHHNLVFEDAVMPAPGYMAVLGTILYDDVG